MLNYNKDDNIFAHIVEDNSKNDNKHKKVGSISIYPDKDDGITEMEINDGYRLQLIPSNRERDVIFVGAESGAGKSYFIKQYCIEYKQKYPKNPIYLISYLDEDVTLDNYKQIERLKAFEPEFLDFLHNITPKEINEEFKDCLVIFDDVDCISEKPIYKKIHGFINKLLRIGRHSNTSIAYLGHELYNCPDLKHILNECHYIVFFPKYLNFKKMKYLLEQYLGLSNDEILRIRNIKNSRHITFIKGYPRIILTQKSVYYLT